MIISILDQPPFKCGHPLRGGQEIRQSPRKKMRTLLFLLKKKPQQ